MNPTYTKIKGRWDEYEKILDEQHNDPDPIMRFRDSTSGNRTCIGCKKEIKEGELSMEEKKTGKHMCPKCEDEWFKSLDPGT